MTFHLAKGNEKTAPKVQVRTRRWYAQGTVFFHSFFFLFYLSFFLIRQRLNRFDA